MKRVMIGTPAHDGKVDCVFQNSLVETIKMAPHFDTIIFPVQIAYDALVQRARNDLVAMALESKVDDLIFMDSDQEWNPAWIFQLLSRPVDVVGGAVPKKSMTPAFNVKALPTGIKMEDNGLMEVECVGTGFLRISAKAMQAVWDISEEYEEDGKPGVKRMVFNLAVVNRKLVSEDNIFCHKWRSLGEKVWIDPTMTCNHVGANKFGGNFLEYLRSMDSTTEISCPL